LYSLLLFATGNEEPVLVWTPPHLQYTEAALAEQLDTTWWIPTGFGSSDSVVDLRANTLTVTNWPFSSQEPLSSSYTIFAAPQRAATSDEQLAADTHPVNGLIQRLIPGLPLEWRGNLLVARHGAAGVVDLTQEDVAEAIEIVQG
jgi:hypothetical protein